VTGCAIRIQENLARAAGEPNAPLILLRMGLKLADVIIEAHDIFGEGVNLAARLQASAEPGGIVFSSAVAEELRARGAIELVDLGTLTLKHISRPVTALTISTTINNTPILALPRSLTDDRPSIAVLPFRVQSANSDDTRFADGIIESIIHILLGIENLFVIGRDTALAYADLDIDLRDVGRDLGVRYVLTGSVRRTDKRLRIRLNSWMRWGEASFARTGIPAP
jgi:adenylate cyclase